MEVTGVNMKGWEEALQKKLGFSIGSEDTPQPTSSKGANWHDFSSLDEAFNIPSTGPILIEDCDDLISGQWGEDNHFYGKKHTEETKQLMKDNHYDCSGKNNSRYGVKLLPDQIEKFKQSKCKFTYLFTKPDGEQFIARSIKEVADEYGLGHPNLYQVLKGKYKQHKGWRVEYASS